MFIYVFFPAQVVKGLGETLVGAYPGRALSFICKKNDLTSPQVTKLLIQMLAWVIIILIVLRTNL